MRDSFGRKQVRALPCGECSQCLQDKQNSWKLRLIEEMTNWKFCFFFTLTYCDEAIPLTDDSRTQVDKRDIQGWLKRFRTRFERSSGVKPEFRYFITSEYAPDGLYPDRHGRYRRSTCRPHYHGLIFTDIPESIIRGTLMRDWAINFGFFKLDSLPCRREDSSSVANYVSKYCCKGCFASRQQEIKQGLINPTFNLMSKGIGSSYVDKYRQFHLRGHHPSVYVSHEELQRIISSRFVRDGSFKYKMPRYYIDKIYKLPEYVTRPVFNRKNFTYEFKSVKRYSSKTPLSLQITTELQRRFEERLRSILDEARLIEASGGSSALNAFWGSTQDVDAEDSRRFAKLQSFYRSAALRNSSLCFSNF